MPQATVHLLRHGEVHNPDGVLYGRLPEFHLSELGWEMAETLAAHFAERAVAGRPNHLSGGVAAGQGPGDGCPHCGGAAP